MSGGEVAERRKRKLRRLDALRQIASSVLSSASLLRFSLASAG